MSEDSRTVVLIEQADIDDIPPKSVLLEERAYGAVVIRIFPAESSPATEIGSTEDTG